MQPWAQIVLVVCAVALTGALVAAMLALGRTLRRADAVLEIVEQELRPLIGQVNGLTQEVRDFTREARHQVDRIGDVTERVQTVADGLGRVVVGLAGFTRAGQIIGLAAGLRRGVDVFVKRLRRGQGDDDGNRAS
jgi:uncharacterized protein YoxC